MHNQESGHRLIQLGLKFSKLGAIRITLITVIVSEITYYMLAWILDIPNDMIGYIMAFIVPVMVAYPFLLIFLGTTRLIQKQNNEIEFKNNLKNTLLSVVSHDVKGPLANLSSLLDFYFQKEINQEELEEMLKDLQGQVKTNLDFVMNILQWTKTQFDGFQVIKIKTNLRLVLEKIIAAYQFQIQQKKVIIETDADLTANVDLDLMRLVLRNLLSNAIKFSSTGGKIKISAKIEKGLLVTTVSDDGLGMGKDKLESVFSERMDSSKGTYMETGTGLGLKLCKTFIEALGGNIWAESEPGKGSTFYFTIPQELKLSNNKLNAK